MSSEEEKQKHSARRKRNMVAKHMFENKGAFALRTIDPRKTTYKRKHLRVNEDYEIYDNTDTDGGNL